MKSGLTIGSKITLFLLTAFAVGIAATAWLLGGAMKTKAELEIEDRAEILMATANAVRRYTTEHIAPLLADEVYASEVFISETVPAFSAHRVFSFFSETSEYGSFSYKEATLNPTNPNDQADEFETLVVERFRADPDLPLQTGYRQRGDETLFYSARPLKVGSESCLVCHSTPDRAPAAQLARFGDEGGFGWSLGEIVAAQMVYVPADEVLQAGRNSLFLAMAVFFGVFFVGTALLNAQIQRSIVAPIRHVTAIAHTLRGGTPSPETLAAFKKPEYRSMRERRDEAGEWFRAFEAMAEEVARREQHLTATVEARTEALREALNRAERAQQQAVEANRTKSQFVANMSHELRTPLNAIIGYSEILKEETADDGNLQYHEDLDRIHQGGRHLLSLVNDILDISRIEAGRVELYLETFDLRAEIDQIVATVQPLVAKNDNRLTVEQRVADSSAGVGTVHADQTKLRQIVLNLLSNAAKFTDHDEIRLIVEGDDAWVRITVQDSGIGMTEEQIGRLFQAFSQADASTTRRYGGTGLGLAISRHFARMMGGDIAVSSVPGEGSRFTLEMPRHVAESATSEPGVTASQTKNAAKAPDGTADSTAESADTSVPLVLVVDDDERVRDLLRRFLEREKYNVVVASSGEEGLEKARALKPDFITLDVMMPGIDGWTVLTRLKADPETMGIPVFVLTMTNDRHLGYALGATEFLTKPIDRDVLLKLFNRHQKQHLSADTGGVLIIDDEPVNRELLRRTLESADARVSEAENGRAALDWLRAQRQSPSLILLDLMMPEMDGFEFIDVLQADEQWRMIPIVVITARTLNEQERARLTGRVEDILDGARRDDQSLLGELRRRIDACTGCRRPPGQEHGEHP
ncbi:MAG: response regulator [Thioalkalivibrionaceae bacterium]